MLRILCLVLALAWAAPAATRYMFLGYGQSLSIGNWGCPAISTTQPYSNQKWVTNALVPLVESAVCSQDAGSTQESPNSAAANNITYLDPSHTFASIWNNFGAGGLSVAALSKGTGLYTNLINVVTAIKNSVTGSGDTLVVLGVLWTQGEADIASTTYISQMLTLQSDLDTDIRAITGQSQSIPMFMSQVSSLMAAATSGAYPAGNLFLCPDASVACIDDPTGAGTPVVPIAHWALQRDYPGRFYLVGPKYQYYYADGSLHMDAQSYNFYGATAARTLYNAVVRNRPRSYGAIFPASITRSDSTITARFHTPNGLALTCDTTKSPTVIRKASCASVDSCTGGTSDTVGCGFQFFQTGGSALTDTYGNGGITAVSCSNQTCTITLSGTPNGTNQRLAYAFEGSRYARSGLATAGGTASPSGAHGGVRTVADYTDLNGDTVYHWLIHFNEAIGFTWDLPGGGLFPLPFSFRQ